MFLSDSHAKVLISQQITDFNSDADDPGLPPVLRCPATPFASVLRRREAAAYISRLFDDHPDSQ
jgi:hypothetical protein